MADENDQSPTTADVPPAESAPEGGAAPAKKAAAKKSAAKKAGAAKTTTKKAAAKKTAAKKTAAEPPADPAVEPAAEPVAADPADTPAKAAEAAEAPAKKTARKAPAKKAAAKKTAAKKSATKKTVAADPAAGTADTADTAAAAADVTEAPEAPGGPAGAAVLFQVPEAKPARKRAPRKSAAKAPEPAVSPDAAAEEDPEELTEPATEETALEAVAADAVEVPELGATPDATTATDADDDSEDDSDDDGHDDTHDGSGTTPRRRRRRGGRRRRKSGGDGDQSADGDADHQAGDATSDGAGGAKADGAEGGAEASSEKDHGADQGDQSGEGGSSRRRRRRRRDGESGDGEGDGGGGSGRARRPRSLEDEITAVAGSTRLEAKKQRRREGREAGRRRAPIVSEAEFLARRESVERVMVVRQRDDLTQIGVLEDKVLVEHYVARESQTSLIGNIYLGRVQNVLPSMEAAFIDIGKGRNAVLYAGEVNWSSLGHKDSGPRKIESVLSSGQSVLVQVTKDPVGQKGARLTSQISLAGRFLVYVPDGTTSGISRKLPDTERNRLKTLLKEIVPDSAGVIVRTAAEGASEEELTRDVERLKARWEDIEAKSKGSAPQLLYGEPDLTLKVVRDLFTEDFASLVIQGDDAWDTVRGYVEHVAPDLEPRLEHYHAAEHNDVDLFSAYRVDEQIAKALDRKVFLPSGGSLVIDRTEAMTVVDVNTGKFTGSGGNLEETVTKNNLEAAEEVVRQLRLRDIGGIIVVDFIDMVLESNRDLVLRRLVECLGRDRTRHQVAEVTSLGLVQMTRKRIGTGLLEAFSVPCDHCAGRGLVVHDLPVEPKRGDSGHQHGGGGRGGNGNNNGNNGGGNNGGGNGGGNGSQDGESGGRTSRRRGGRGRSGDAEVEVVRPAPVAPSPAQIAAMAPHPPVDASDEAPDEATVEAPVETPAAEAALQETAPPAPAPEPAVAEPATVEPVAPVEEPPAAAAASEPAVPAQPTVVTRTRGRRGASRSVPPAAGPEVLAATPVAVTVPAATAPAAEADETPKVTVTTRTRGSRSASTGASGEAHVPVKRKR